MSNKQKYSKKKPNSVLIDADFRIKIEKAIEDFVHNSNDMIYEFPATLTNVERAFVHNLAPKYSLKTKSVGFGEIISRFSLLTLSNVQLLMFQTRTEDFLSSSSRKTANSLIGV